MQYEHQYPPKNNLQARNCHLPSKYQTVSTWLATAYVPDTKVRDLGVSGYFSEIVGRGDIYAPDKTGLARRWAQTRKPGRCLMIGDTEHDLACAEAAGFDCLLVRGGHTSDGDLDRIDCRVLPDLFALKEVLFGAET